MTCHYCGTALPEGALFCGECGQPVAAAVAEPATGSSVLLPAARSAQGSLAGTGTAVVDSEDSEESDDWDGSSPETVSFSIADLAFSSPGDTSQPDDDGRDLPDGSPLDGADESGPTARCPQCGEPMAAGDVFCGECGFVVRTVAPPTANLVALGEFPADPDAPEVGSEPEPESEPESGLHDADATTEVEPVSMAEVDAETDAETGAEADPEPEAEAGVEAGVEPDFDDPSDIDDLDDLVIESGPASVSPAPEGDPDLEFDDPLPFSEPEVKPRAEQSPRSRPIPDPFPWGIEQPLREDLEATRLVADSAAGTRYVLQFSTGESVTVAGSGLVGRNPSMQPGEYVDQLVPIFDAGKSVSKTHLEFGQEAGRFWVTDRYSTNGSVIRQPDTEPRRCDAGRRYFIARGTRVDVGEQFFVVS